MKIKTKVSSAVISINGNKREKNEDNYFVNGEVLGESGISFPAISKVHRGGTHLFCVFDGMGGEHKGELASSIAAESFTGFYKRIKKSGTNVDLNECINDHLNILNTEILGLSQNKSIGNMGTTIASLIIDNGYAHVNNLGDSRVYFYRRSKMNQITNDHSEAAILVKLGVINKDDARTHASKYRLTQHLGLNADGIILKSESYEPIKLLKNDIFILCSDGLVDDLSDKELTDIITNNISVHAMLNKMAELALKKNGNDNITIIGVKIEKFGIFF